MTQGTPVTLDEITARLEAYTEKYTSLIGEILQADGGNGYPADFMVLPLLNRSTKLVSGFLTLIKEQNYLCAIPLIRLQLDNALRYYATALVDNPDGLVLDFLKGKPINKMKDRKHQQMRDGYLADQLNKELPGVKSIYTSTSGYVHLSDKHFFVTITPSGKDAGRMKFGNGPDLFTLVDRINFVNQMVQCSEVVYRLIEEWKNFKQNKTQ